MRSYFIAACMSVPTLASAQDFDAPPPFPLSAEARLEIESKTAKLGEAIGELRKQGLRDAELADVAVYHRAARMIVAHNEFFNKNSAADTLTVLDLGLERAKELMQGHTPWTAASGLSTIRAYASRIDGSPQ